jgi:aminotransferase
VQGFPIFRRQRHQKRRAVSTDVNQYRHLGRAPRGRSREFWRCGLEIVADRQVTVCCGATEAMMCMVAIIDPGDEVVIGVLRNYGPDAILSGATPLRHAALPDWSFAPVGTSGRVQPEDRGDHHQYSSPSQGKVFSRDEPG